MESGLITTGSSYPSFRTSSDFSGTEIEIWNIHDRYPHLNHFVHREIVETLYGEKKSYLKKIYGMKWLCPGCETCLDFADECDEHDFVTMKNLQEDFLMEKYSEKLKWELNFKMKKIH
ncbi:unnamed protein product [Caenorhabditis nigoni]